MLQDCDAQSAGFMLPQRHMVQSGWLLTAGGAEAGCCGKPYAIHSREHAYRVHPRMSY
jgi:hypothetical protein